MVSSSAKTVAAYLKELSPERRKVVAAVREVIRANLPEGYEESMQYGMIGYSVPLSRFPKTYNGAPLAYAGLAAQKNHYAVYLMGIYGDAALRQWFEDGYKKTGKRMDVGKSCVRFKKLEDLPLETIGEAVSRVPVDAFLAMYEDARKSAKRR